MMAANENATRVDAREYELQEHLTRAQRQLEIARALHRGPFAQGALDRAEADRDAAQDALDAYRAARR